MVKKIGKKFIFFLTTVFIILAIAEVTMRAYGWLLLKQRDRQQHISDDALTILCLGESTTMLGGRDSYPSQLQRILRERFPEKEIKVINKGLAGKNTDMILEKAPEFLTETSPDIAIVMMGINDNVLFLDKKPFVKNQRFHWLEKFRVVRFFRLLKRWLFRQAVWTSVHQTGQDLQEAIPLGQKRQEDLSQTSEEYKRKVFWAYRYFANKKYDEAERLLRHLIRRKECVKCVFEFRRILMQALFAQKKFEEMIEELPDIPYWAYEELHVMDLCDKPRYAPKILKIIDQRVAQNPRVPFYYDKKADCCERAKKVTKAEKARKEAQKLREKYINTRTQKNYLQLDQLLREKGIVRVYAQYPMQDVNSLKQMLISEPSADEIIFIDNNRIFQEKVSKKGYKTYFSDRFAGLFGHCTPEGNRILAEHIANSLIQHNTIN